MNGALSSAAGLWCGAAVFRLSPGARLSDSSGMIKLGVNIDHVATLRQARYRGMPDAPNTEPDPRFRGLGGRTRAEPRHNRRISAPTGDIFRMKTSTICARRSAQNSTWKWATPLKLSSSR